MKNLISFLGRILPFAIVGSLSITTALAQQAQVQIVRADINGNQINMYLDHDSLQRFVNQAVGAMDGDADGSLLEWSDVLTNGNNPEMNVNFSGYSVFGIDSLTSTGVLLADSLVLNKDAEITGKLILGDSLAVAGAAALDSTLSVAGYTRVNDSLYVLKAALFAADVSVGDSLLVTGAAALDSTLAVTGITTLSDSLVVAGNSDLNGTLDVTGETTITGELHASDSLVVAGNADFDATLNVDGNATVGGTLAVTGTASAANAVADSDLITKGQSDTRDDSLATAVAANDQDIIALNGRADSLATAVAANDTDIATLNTTQDSIESAIQANDTDIATLNTTQDSIESAIQANDTDIATLNTTQDSIESAIQANDTDIATLNTTQDSIESAIQANDTDIATLNTTQDSIESAIQANDTDIATLNTTQDSLENAISSNDTELDSIFARGDSIINVLYWNNTAGVLSHDAGIDSVHVDGVLQVNGNETVGGTFGVTGVTTLSDSLYGTNADLAGTTTTTFLRVDSSFALFPTAVASGVGSMAIGEEAVASDVSAIAIGARTEASSYSAIAIGNGATAGMNAVAVGRDATASGEGSVALGDSASVNSLYSNIAIGFGADAGLSGDYSWGTLALGAHSHVAGSQNIAFTMGRVNAGAYNIAMAKGSVVDTVSDGDNGTTGSIAFGFDSKIGESGVSHNAMTFGQGSRANGTNNFAFGSFSFVDSHSGAPSFNNIAFGNSTHILNGSSNSFAFGNTSKIEADAGQYAFNTFTFGNGSVIDGHWPSNSFAFGNESKVSGFNVVNFANNSPARFSNLAMFGQYADTSGFAVTVDADLELDSRSGWIATDPLFVIANGLDDTQRSNAFVMLKDGSLAVTGDVELGSDLEVTGDLVVSTNVDVDGTVELHDDLDVNGDTDLDDTDVDGTLDVTGATGVDGDFDVASTMFTVASGTGNTAIAGTLGVTGVATLATVDINGGSIDGTKIGASAPSTVGATTIDASGDVTFNGDNFVAYTETSIHNNLIVLDKTVGTTTQFSVNEANGNTMIAGALDMTNFDVDASGNLDLDANLDMDGTTADFQASGAISLDAGSASNFTTTAGALILEGAGGVTVTSTGGTMALNGAGQTVDLDATTLDVDATTITVDATTTTFTGDVKGPKATGDDEFVTYFQLDSLANQAPYNETYIMTKKDDTYSQTITVGGGEQEVQIMPTANPLYLGFVVDMSDAVLALDVDGISNNEPISVLASGGASGSTQAFKLKEPGMYESSVTLQVTNPNANDAMVTLSLMNYDPGTQSTWDNPRVLSCATEVVYGQSGANGAFNVPVHFNMASTYKMDNENEDVYLVIETVGEDVIIQSFAFSVSRSGE